MAREKLNGEFQRSSYHRRRRRSTKKKKKKTHNEVGEREMLSPRDLVKDAEGAGAGARTRRRTTTRRGGGRTTKWREKWKC